MLTFTVNTAAEVVRQRLREALQSPVMKIREILRRGDPAIWFTGTGLGICLLMITGMIGLIMINGLGFFWPKPLTHVTLADGTVLLGEVVAREVIPKPGVAGPELHRLQFKLGNRDLSGADFKWIDESAIKARTLPREAVYVERREYGPFIGVPVRLSEGDKEVARGADATWQAVQPLIAKAARDRARIDDIEVTRLARSTEIEAGGRRCGRSWAQPPRTHERTAPSRDLVSIRPRRRTSAQISRGVRDGSPPAAPTENDLHLSFGAYRATELSVAGGHSSLQPSLGVLSGDPRIKHRFRDLRTVIWWSSSMLPCRLGCSRRLREHTRGR